MHIGSRRSPRRAAGGSVRVWTSILSPRRRDLYEPGQCLLPRRRGSSARSICGDPVPSSGTGDAPWHLGLIVVRFPAPRQALQNLAEMRAHRFPLIGDGVRCGTTIVMNEGPHRLRPPLKSVVGIRTPGISRTSKSRHQMQRCFAVRRTLSSRNGEFKSQGERIPSPPPDAACFRCG